eukprot:scaffold391_cov412-Pavlova_lutheri.AAC.3
MIDRQQGYASPSSYILEPFRETKALQYFLRFFPHELLPDWVAEIRRRGQSKYNTPGDNFLSYDRECTLGVLLRVFGCFVYMLLHLGHRKKSSWQVIDVEKDPLAVYVPKYTAERGTREDRLEQAGACKGPIGIEYTLQGDPRWEVRRFKDAWNAHASRHYSPSWLVVVNESVLKWMGRKPDDLDKELKTMCDGLTGV